jgi:hypothetical protein
MMDDFDPDDGAATGSMGDFDGGGHPPPRVLKKWAGQLAQSAAHTVQELTSRKYALPDKNVASQLLMYRQVRAGQFRFGTTWTTSLYFLLPSRGSFSRFPIRLLLYCCSCCC